MEWAQSPIAPLWGPLSLLPASDHMSQKKKTSAMSLEWWLEAKTWRQTSRLQTPSVAAVATATV